MTRPEDAALASALGADAIGIIFYKKSARNVSLDQAHEIVAAVSPLCTTVAVVVNPEVEEVDRILEQVPIALLQFHGDESAAFCEQFERPYMKAIKMQANTDLSQLSAQYKGARGLLLDTFDVNMAGGTGRPFDWSMLESSVRADGGPEIVLAGGLTPDNVVQAIQQTGITNLDVNSGIERSPGIKDQVKMRAIMRLKYG